jgi:hypothetical protein
MRRPGTLRAVVHVIFIEGEAPNVASAMADVKRASEGHVQLRHDLIVVSGDLDIREWRARVAAHDVQTVVAKLSGSWASHGMPDVSEWLKGARRDF